MSLKITTHLLSPRLHHSLGWGWGHNCAQSTTLSCAHASGITGVLYVCNHVLCCLLPPPSCMVGVKLCNTTPLPHLPFRSMPQRHMSCGAMCVCVCTLHEIKAVISGIVINVVVQPCGCTALANVDVAFGCRGSSMVDDDEEGCRTGSKIQSGCLCCRAGNRSVAETQTTIHDTNQPSGHHYVNPTTPTTLRHHHL